MDHNATTALICTLHEGEPYAKSPTLLVEIAG